MSITERFERAIQELVRQGFRTSAVTATGPDWRAEMLRTLASLPAPAVVWSGEDHEQMSRAVAPRLSLALYWRGDGAALRALHDAFVAAGFAIAWTESMGPGMRPAMQIRVRCESGSVAPRHEGSRDRSENVAVTAVA